MSGMNVKALIFSGRGFIFFDALLDLLLIALFMPLIILFYLFTTSYMENLHAGEIEWRLFLTDMQNYLTDVESIQVINGGTGFRVRQAGTEYDVELYSNLIRKQKFNQGHEVMMTGITKCNFSIEGKILTIMATRSTGKEERSEYVITGP
jgi:competence protein ComGF